MISSSAAAASAPAAAVREPARQRARWPRPTQGQRGSTHHGGAGKHCRDPRGPDILLDADAVRSLAVALRESGGVGGFGLSALWDGPSAVRAEIVGLAFALASGRRVYLPLGHRYLGAPASVRVGEALPLLEPALADATIQKSLHDAKTVEVLLRRAGVILRGVAGDAMLAAYLLDASRTRYEIDIVAAGSAIRDVCPRAVWMGSGKGTRAASDVTVGRPAAG